MTIDLPYPVRIVIQPLHSVAYVWRCDECCVAAPEGIIDLADNCFNCGKGKYRQCLEVRNDGSSTNNPVSESDAGATVGPCSADKAVADLALDLAYIDPRIKSCDQARIRVGAEFLLRVSEGETKEDAAEALLFLFQKIAIAANWSRSISRGLAKEIYKSF